MSRQNYIVITETIEPILGSEYIAVPTDHFLFERPNPTLRKNGLSFAILAGSFFFDAYPVVPPETITLDKWAQLMSQPYFAKTLITPSGLKNMSVGTVVANDHPNGYYRSLTLDQPASDLTDFPVLFKSTLTYLKTISNGGKVNNTNGYDIIFYSDAALTTKLKFERVFWDATTGEVEFWIKVPTLASASATVIYLAYGNTSISTDQQDAANTWSNGYGLVQHLANGTTLSLADSTGVQTPTNHSATANSSGKIDGAVTFNGSSTSYHVADFYAGTRKRTYSYWINMNNLPGVGLICVIGKRASAPNEMAIYIGSDGKCRLLIYNTLPVQICDFTANTGVGTAAWVYITFTVDQDAANAHVKAYFNGSADGSVDSSSPGVDIKDNTDDYYFGQEGDGSRFMDGSLDEVHIGSSVVRTDTWIATEYSNQNDPANFYIIGSETPV